MCACQHCSRPLPNTHCMRHPPRAAPRAAFLEDSGSAQPCPPTIVVPRRYPASYQRPSLRFSSRSRPARLRAGPKSDIFEATPSPPTSVFRASLELLALAASFAYVRQALLASPARGRQRVVAAWHLLLISVRSPRISTQQHRTDLGVLRRWLLSCRRTHIRSRSPSGPVPLRCAPNATSRERASSLRFAHLPRLLPLPRVRHALGSLAPRASRVGVARGAACGRRAAVPRSGRRGLGEMGWEGSGEEGVGM